jgi:hypothetical protein
VIPIDIDNTNDKSIFISQLTFTFTFVVRLVLMFVLQSFKASTKRKTVTVGFISTAKVRVSFGLSLLKNL